MNTYLPAIIAFIAVVILFLACLSFLMWKFPTYEPTREDPVEYYPYW